MPRRLPPELVDKAISYYVDISEDWNRASIRGFALVSRDWAAICRPHIFREIRINKRRASQFFALLQTTPAIGIVVKRVMFDGRDKHRKRTGLSWLASALSSLHKYLPNINDVRISYADIRRPKDAVDWTTALYPLLETMEFVRTLAFESTSASIAIFQELSCTFPNLDCVTLVECDFQVGDHDRKTTYARSPIFRQLYVDWYGNEWTESTDAWPSTSLDQFVPFLLTAEPNRSLRSLKLDVCREHLRSVVSLLDQLGSRLEELILQVKINESDNDEYPGPITLNSNTNLKHLTLAVPKLDDNYWEWTTTISSTHLRRLEYHLIFDETDFTALASELTKPIFSGLDELTFVCLTVCGTEDPDPEIRANVENYIPTFMNRHGHDVLRFKNAKWDYSAEPYDVFDDEDRSFSYNDEVWDSWDGGDEEEDEEIN
ncbi:hypothetical protein QCA50_006176 [Cerrena zonata]|uniref:F-box domain-containing protein n=1 Tax=Cerrena zonata TaxID=2478898 RepID=A0AAW0GC16_9APHY